MGLADVVCLRCAILMGLVVTWLVVVLDGRVRRRGRGKG